MSAQVNASKNKKKPQKGKRQRKKQPPRKDVVKGKVTQKVREDTLKMHKTATSMSNLMAPGVAKECNIQQALSTSTLANIAWGYICQALSRGWLANAGGPDYPASAYQYIVQVFKQFANGGIPAAQKMPYWMLAVGRALSPKSVKTGEASIYYKFDVNDTFTPSPFTTIGPISYGYEGLLYISTGSLVNGFPVAQPPIVATPGETAFNSLISFVENSGSRRDSNRMVTSQATTTFDSDVTVFSNIALTNGGGNAGIGGASFCASLEVPLYSPVLSTLAVVPGSPPVEGNKLRAFNWNAEFSGDQISNSWLLHSYLPPKFWHFKRRPKYKFIDLLEFIDVAAQWTAKIVTQWYSDPAQAVVPMVGSGQDPAIGKCPLTLQDFSLLFRNDILYVMQTQPGVQSLYPVTPSGSSDNEFVAFVQGTTTVALGSSGMKVPKPLSENISSLVDLHCGKYTDSNLYIPVLGKYYSDALLPGDYQYEYTDSSQQVQKANVFSTEPPLFVRRKNTKTGISEMVQVAEVAVDLIDGSAGNQYLFINDLSRLNKLASIWNEWVSRFATYSSPLTTIQREHSPSPLWCVDQTRVWYPSFQMVKDREADFVDMRITRDRGLSATVYSDRQQIAQTFWTEPFAEAEAITNLWITPISRLTIGPTNNDTSTYVKLQILNQELYGKTVAPDGFSGVSLASKHSTYASMMTHAKDGKSALDDLFTALDAQGKGGILSSLVAKFVGSTFGDTAGNVAGMIADALPI